MKTGGKVLAGLAVALGFAAAAGGQSDELKARAEAEGFVLAPAEAQATTPSGEEYFAEDEGYKWPGVALGVRFGTTGVGRELTVGINRWLNLRGGYNWMDIEPSLKASSVKYKGDIDLSSAALLLDVHPFGGVFRLTGGAYYYLDGEGSFDATPKKPWTQIGNHRYEPATIGTISGHAAMDNEIVPYAGIGWGNSVAEGKAMTVSLDIGVIFQNYTVDPLTCSGSGATAEDPTFRRDLAKERKRLQDDLDDWSIYPVVTLSVAYHF